MIIAPHPDDEIFGCGGLLASYAAAGKKTDILFITQGEASHKNCCMIPSSQIGDQRRLTAVAANDVLGVTHGSLHFMEGKDGNLPRYGQPGFKALTEKIAVCMEKIAPTAVFCPHPFEEWPDHIAAEELTMAAINMLSPPAHPIFYHYCVWFWYSISLKRTLRINWRHAHLLDISAQFLLKQQAMRTYLDALAPCGNPWVGKLPPQLLRAFDWDKELFFKADILNPAKKH